MPTQRSVKPTKPTTYSAQVVLQVVLALVVNKVRPAPLVRLRHLDVFKVRPALTVHGNVIERA